MDLCGHETRVLGPNCCLKTEGSGEHLSLKGPEKFYNKKKLVLYAFFWVIPRRLNFICRRFGTLSLLNLHWRIGISLWRWNRQSVPKRRYIKFRRLGITQKKHTAFRTRRKFEIKRNLVNCHCLSNSLLRDWREQQNWDGLSLYTPCPKKIVPFSYFFF